MKKPDLKPCPFCGGKPISSYIPPHEHHIVDLPPYEGSGCVECPDCECAVVARTEEEAIEKWNRRVCEPVRHGRWIKGGQETYPNEYVCSECGDGFPIAYAHCLNCGAMMDAKEGTQNDQE